MELVHSSVPLDELEVRRSEMSCVAQVSEAAGGPTAGQGRGRALGDHARGVASTT